MLMKKWSNFVRNWFSQVARNQTPSRNTIRHRQALFSRQVAIETLESRTLLSAIAVTGTGDSINVDGIVTLREAIASLNGGANINADVIGVGTYGVTDAINFNIAGAGTQIISPASPLPVIVKPVAIDGYSQTGTSTNTLVNSDNAILIIQLDGVSAGLGANGLVLGTGSDNSSVSGLIISGFSGAGILVQSDGNTLTGNFLGTDSTGNIGVSGTSGFGIGIAGGFRNTIGGTMPAARNVIGGNSDGINLNSGSQNNVIQGNFIGVGADGATAVGNRLHGVALSGNGGLGIQNNEIGGTQAFAGNTIANNGRAGVAVFGDPLSLRQNTGNTILGNSIYNNGLNSPATLPGIDLVSSFAYPTDDGVTPNDLTDSDIGPNTLQNFPVLTSATSNDISTTISGSLNSSSNTTFRIEFFSNPTVIGTNFGQGQTFLGFVKVTTDATGNASFTATVGTSVPNGHFMTATATSGGSVTGEATTSPASVLGSAADFAVLAASTVTITGPTVLIGDVGVFPGSVISGTFTTTGTIHVADPVASLAQTDLIAGYNYLAGITPFVDLTGQELGGLTLTPGIYHFDTSAQLTGPLPLTLNTQGDPHALFVFQIGSTLTTAAGVGSAVVTQGGPSDNIYWQVGSSATIGVGTAFVGNIVALTSITLETGATLSSGRALARNGAVTLDSIIADSTTPSQNNTSEFSAATEIAIPSITINDVTISEGDSGTTNAVFTVSLSASSAQTVTVVATPADGTATFPSDYITLLPTTVTFAPGETTKTFTVAVNGDLLAELDETFFVNLTAPTNATLSDNQGLGTITNDDPPPTVTINDVLVLEGDAGTTSAVFTVTLSGASGLPVTVVVTSANDTATFPSDYLALPATTLTFAPGETTKTVTVTINGDTLSEASETFFVNLTAPINATFGDNQGVGTIINDDPVPTLSINDVTLLEGDSGVTNAVFTVTLSTASGQAVTVVATSADGTATFPSDYTALPATTLTFAPGETTKTITVAVNGDILSEASETYFVNLTGAVNATITDNQGLGTITNDDLAPVLSVNDVTVLEGNAGTINAVFTVTLSAASGQTVTVVAVTADGTATLPSDYIALPLTTLTFAPGETTKTVTVAVNGDLLSESDETFFVNLTTPINATLSDNQGLGTILNDDSAPALSISNVTLLEGDAATTSAVFTVTLAAVSGQTVTVVATSADGTGSAPSDYIALPATTLTFAPGETTKIITVAVNGDVLSEANETFFVNLTAPINATLTNTQGLGTIVNDDPVPTLSINDVVLQEGDAGTTSAVFTVTLSTVSGQPVTVVATSADGTATLLSDYVALQATTLTFAPGETTKTVTVAVNGDLLSEADETFFVNLTGAINAVVVDNQGLGTITNDDAAPSLSINDVSVQEGNAGTTNAVFTVTLSAASGQTVTVVTTTADGTAALLSDYIALPSTTLTFAPGETTKTVTVAVNGDILSESDETFFVNLTTPINATLNDNQGLGTIINDDAAPTLSINDVTLQEGNAGTTNAVFTVTLAAASGQTVTVVATSSDGTAMFPTDYIALPPTTLTFAPGETTKTIAVAVNGDVLPEGDETFFVNLTTPINATIADNQGLGTIIDGETSPTLSINDVTLQEGNAGTTDAVFTVTLSTPSAQIVTVVATSADATASLASDYIALPATTLTFAPGETTQTVTVTVNGDILPELNETFVVNLTTPINATVADNQGIGTIINDDATPTLSINDVSVQEGNANTTNAVFTVTLSAASSQTVTVVVNTANDSATSASDYIALSPTTLTFAPGETTKTVTVVVNGDLLSEADESFFVVLTGAINATVSDNQGLGTIVNDDLAPNLSIDNVTVLEGNAGTTDAVFTITLSAVSGQAVTVVATSANGTGTAPSDFIALPATTLTFAPGETTKTVTVAVNGDILSEADETFFVNLSAPINASLTGNQGLATIINDDSVPALSISDVTVLEGNAGTTNAVFTVTLSAPSGQPVTIIATSADGTAADPSDYIALPPTTLTFAPGETTKTVTVAVNGDFLSEANETFFVNLTGVSNATVTNSQGLGTIINDDTVPTVAINDVTVQEGNAGTANAVFTVTLSAPSGQPVTVVATSADNTATQPSDYIALPPTTLTFAPGETTKTVTVAVNGDILSEADETFFVNLTGVSNATVNDNQGLGTIINDDTVPTVAINDVTVQEGNAGTANAVFTVTLSAPSGQPVTVVATSADGTAAVPSDYIALPPTTLTFAPGETTKTVTVSVNGDILSEANETFFVNLTGVSNATVNDNQGLGTIINDDTVPTVAINDVTVQEGNAGTTNAVFTVTLSAPSGQPVTVVATSADNTATQPSDYIALPPTTLTFAPGETTKTVTVAVNGDFLSEANETFFVNLTGVSNATVNDNQGLGTIINDDTVPTVSINDVTVQEGNAGTTSAVFTVTLSTASGQPVTVVATSSDGTATVPSDYIALHPTTLTFAPGETTKTVTVAVNGDILPEANETFFVNLTGVSNATVNDNQGLGTIINDETVPTLSINNVTVQEGNAGTTNAVFTVTLSAPSGQPVTVIATSADNTATQPSDYIALPPTTLTFAPGETTKTVTVTVNGDVLVEGDETFFINLTTPNNASVADNQGLGTIANDDTVLTPVVITSPATASVAENTPAATVVLTVTATPIAGHTLTYSLSGPDAARFTIIPTTGEIKFAVSPDYEAPTDQGANNVYNVTVTATADFTPTRSTSQDLTITVTPVNDLTPVFVNASPTFTLTENSAVGTNVGTVPATDGDLPIQMLTYSIVSGNASGAFSIDPNTGAITVADSTALNFEATTSFTLVVRVVDNVVPTRSADAVVVVNLTNVEEGPFIMIPRANGIFHMGRIPAFVSPDSTFTYDEVSQPDYSNAKLTVSIVNNRDTRDRLDIFPKGDGAGRINVKGHKVYFSGKQIGTFTGGQGNRRPDLVISLNSQATTSAVDNLMRRLNFHVDTNVGTTRTVNIQVTNIGGVDSNLATRAIAVVDIR